MTVQAVSSMLMMPEKSYFHKKAKQLWITSHFYSIDSAHQENSLPGRSLLGTNDGGNSRTTISMWMGMEKEWEWVGNLLDNSSWSFQSIAVTFFSLHRIILLCISSCAIMRTGSDVDCSWMFGPFNTIETNARRDAGTESSWHVRPNEPSKFCFTLNMSLRTIFAARAHYLHHDDVLSLMLDWCPGLQ